MAIVIAKDFETVGRPAWDALVARSPDASLFQSWGWLRAWWQARHAWTEAPGDPLIVAVEGDGGAWRAVAPLIVHAGEQGRTVRFMADSQSPVTDIVCAATDSDARAQVLDALWEQRDRWDAISLRGVPARSGTLAAVDAWTRRHGLESGTTRRDPHFVLSLGSDTISPRADASRAALTVTHDDDPDRISARINQFFGQHIQSSGTRETPSRFVERWHRDFARGLVAELAPGRGVILSTAYAADVPVAMHLGLVSGGDAWWYEPAVDVVSAVAGARETLLREFAVHAQSRGAAALLSTQRAALTALSESVAARETVTVSLAASSRSSLREMAARSRVVRRFEPVFTEGRQLLTEWRTASRIVDDHRRKMEVADSHRDFYDVGSVLKQYVRLPRLLKPELTIFRELRDQLPDMRVLDVAVGAGRTTPFLATVAREYRAYDYATKMVEACRHIMGDIVPLEHITCDDARDMQTVASASSDFVFISYNGIDTVGPEEDRLRVLREVRRVGVPGGYFAFSAHNMKGLTPTWSGEPGLAAATGPNLPARLRHWRRYVLLRAANPNLATLRRQPKGMVLDSGGEYAFPHYYITAAAQVRQLEEMGFRDVRVFSANTGLEIADPMVRDNATDSWLHYLCRI